MKRRLLSLILTAVMLLSAMAGFSGCGKSGFGSPIKKRKLEI